MASERLRKCNAFSELRAGMVVVDIDCQSCGRSGCRGMLIDLIEPDNDEAFWERVPPCVDLPDFKASTGEEDVRAGRIYIVDDGEETKSERREPKEMEVV